MAQFVGTGKGRYVEGQPFDIPDADIEQQKIIEKRGFGRRVELLGQTGPPNPARRVVELSDADLRDDPLRHPQDAAIRDTLSEDEEREIDSVHDEGAVGKEHAKAVEKAASEHPADTGEAGANPVQGTEGQSERLRDEEKAPKSGSSSKSRSKSSSRSK